MEHGLLKKIDDYEKYKKLTLQLPKYQSIYGDIEKYLYQSQNECNWLQKGKKKQLTILTIHYLIYHF